MFGGYIASKFILKYYGWSPPIIDLSPHQIVFNGILVKSSHVSFAFAESGRNQKTVSNKGKVFKYKKLTSLT